MNKIRIALGQVVDPNAKIKEPKKPKIKKEKPNANLTPNETNDNPANNSPVENNIETGGSAKKPITAEGINAIIRRKTGKPKTVYPEKLYTMEEIKRELYGFRLMTDPTQILEGAVIKYIRIDGPDAYKYRSGGFLIINLTTIFHIKSPYGVVWQIFTDPNKNIIFYYYPQTTRGIMVGDVEFRTKDEIEESGDGVISQITPGKLSAIMINSQLGGTIPLEKKDDLIREIVEHSNYNESFTNLIPKNEDTHKLVKIPKNIEPPLKKEKEKIPKPAKVKKETKEQKDAPKVKLVSKSDPKTKQMQKPTPKKSKKEKDYSYETSYSLPEYSYDYSDSLSIIRNKPRSIPRKGISKQ